MNNMKKLLTILLAAALCLSLAACGDSAPDKQPAIDAYNELVENYNKFVDITNEDLSDWSEEHRLHELDRRCDLAVWQAAGERYRTDAGAARRDGRGVQ